MKKPKFYIYLWIIGLIILGYALLYTSGSSALDINLHDTYFAIDYISLAIGLSSSLIVIGFILWIASKINQKRNIN
jgi:heme/copper-type cytochrome/quinol oxidase subunit 1